MLTMVINISKYWAILKTHLKVNTISSSLPSHYGFLHVPCLGAQEMYGSRLLIRPFYHATRNSKGFGKSLSRYKEEYFGGHINKTVQMIGPEFDLASRYSVVINTIFITLTVCA
jgi:hypothetical protein